MKLRYHLATLASAAATYHALQTIIPTWLAVIGAAWLAGIVAFVGLVHEQLTEAEGYTKLPAAADTLKTAEDDGDQQLSDSGSDTPAPPQSADGAV